MGKLKVTRAGQKFVVRCVECGECKTVWMQVTNCSACGLGLWMGCSKCGTAFFYKAKTGEVV